MSVRAPFAAFCTTKVPLWLILGLTQIGINFTDPVFRGVYHGKRGHPDDFEDMLERAKAAGCEKFMVTGSDLKESKNAVKLAEQHRQSCTQLKLVVLLN